MGGLPHVTRHPALSAAVTFPRKVVLLSLPGLRLTLIASCVDGDHRFSGASRRRFEKIGASTMSRTIIVQWPANREKRVVGGFCHGPAKKRINSFAPPTTRVATKIAKYASLTRMLRNLRRACASERRSGFISRLLGIEGGYSHSHHRASGWRGRGQARPRCARQKCQAAGTSRGERTHRLVAATFGTIVTADLLSAKPANGSKDRGRTQGTVLWLS